MPPGPASHAPSLQLNVTRIPGHGVMADRAVYGRAATCQRTQLG